MKANGMWVCQAIVSDQLGGAEDLVLHEARRGFTSHLEILNAHWQAACTGSAEGSRRADGMGQTRPHRVMGIYNVSVNVHFLLYVISCRRLAAVIG